MHAFNPRPAETEQDSAIGDMNLSPGVINYERAAPTVRGCPRPGYTIPIKVLNPVVPKLKEMWVETSSIRDRNSVLASDMDPVIFERVGQLPEQVVYLREWRRQQLVRMVFN